jgi:ABC-type metal ion transport system substrate-binding protein
VGWAATDLRIGTLAGADADLALHAAALARQAGLDLRVVVFSDHRSLAGALAHNAVRAICGLNEQQLRAVPGAAGLVAGFATVTLPTGIYSRRVKSMVQLADGATIVLPEEPIEHDRARVLLYNYRLLFAHEDDGLTADLHTIVNPRHFVLQTAPAAALAGRLSDADAVVIPYRAAVSAGLRPDRDSIGLEDGKSPYAEVVAVRQADGRSAWLAAFAKAFQSRDMRRYIMARYGDSIQPPW